MLLKLLLDLMGSNIQNEQSQSPKKKSQSALRREKDRRDYDLWVMSEEDRYDGDDEE